MRLRVMLELLLFTCVATACAAGSTADPVDERDDGVTEAEPAVEPPRRREPSPTPTRSITPFGPPPRSPVEHVDEQESAPIVMPPRPRR